MKITIIGSTAYLNRMIEHKHALEREDHRVFMPAFDFEQHMNELDICEFNKGLIAAADEIHILWDQRSIGTVFDLGVAFALNKKIKIIYLNDKNFSNFIKLYEHAGGNADGN